MRQGTLNVTAIMNVSPLGFEIAFAIVPRFAPADLVVASIMEPFPANNTPVSP